MQSEHGDFGVLSVSAGQYSVASVEDPVVRSIPVFDYLESAVDLTAEFLVGEVVAGEDRADDPAELFECKVDGFLGAAALHEPA